MLGFFTVVIMLILAYCYVREGLLTAVTMCCNVVLAGLIAFNFWEPIATELDPVFADSFLNGYEDCLCLMLLFSLSLGLLRLLTNSLAPNEIDYPPLAQQIGAGAMGVVTGYLVAGFLLCLLQTLPWQENFLGFDSKADAKSSIRRVLPPDRVWLSMMHFAGQRRLGWGDGPTFDPDGSFELRYARLRRTKAE